MLVPERAGARRSARALRLAASLALLVACGGREEVAPAAPGAAPAARSLPAPGARGLPAPGARAEEAGRTRVERDGAGRFRVRARGASRFLVLQELARVARFSIRPGAGTAPPLRLDLDLEGVSVEAALARILGDVPYHLHYEALTAEGGEVALRSVTVGLLPAEPVAHAGVPPVARAGKRSAKAEPAREGLSGRREERALSDEERLAEIEAKRHSSLDDERAEAASLMRAEEQLPDLTLMLSSDASAKVRASAAAALGEAEGGESAFRAVDALLAALHDADPGVVAAAVQALEDLHDLLPDPRIAAAVAPLARHGDARVRKAAESFREWTEDEP